MNDKEPMEGEIVVEEEVNTLVPANNQMERIDSNTIIANMDAQIKIKKAFMDYVSEGFKAGVDFYRITEHGKDSLGQPGAQKIDDFLGVYPVFEISDKVLTKDHIFYDVICFLHRKSDDKRVGSGGGNCSSMEDNYLYEWVYERDVPEGMDKSTLQSKKKQFKGNWYTNFRIVLANHFNVANTIKKMAFKRAQVDATIRSTFASEIYTQDLEGDSYIGAKVKRASDAPEGGSKPRNDEKGTSGKGEKEYASNREVLETFEWAKYNVGAIPANEGWTEKNGKKFPPSNPLSQAIYHMSMAIIKDKKEAGSYIKKLVNKNTWDMNYGELKKVADALIEIDDDMKNDKKSTEEEGKKMENVTDEQMEIK